MKPGKVCRIIGVSLVLSSVILTILCWLLVLIGISGQELPPYPVSGWPQDIERFFLFNWLLYGILFIGFLLINGIGKPLHPFNAIMIMISVTYLLSFFIEISVVPVGSYDDQSVSQFLLKGVTFFFIDILIKVIAGVMNIIGRLPSIGRVSTK